MRQTGRRLKLGHILVKILRSFDRGAGLRVHLRRDEWEKISHQLQKDKKYSKSEKTDGLVHVKMLFFQDQLVQEGMAIGRRRSWMMGRVRFPAKISWHANASCDVSQNGWGWGFWRGNRWRVPAFGTLLRKPLTRAK